LQLRLFQLLGEIFSENNSTVIIPVPIDLFGPYLSGSDGSGSGYARRQPAPVRRREGEAAERYYEGPVGKPEGAQ
jgi:hypothetical protein